MKTHDDILVSVFFRYFSYAQGLPLVIVMITAIVDARTREVIDDVTDDAYLPNMGVYDCFLGDQKRDPKPSYFSTAKFLYFQGRYSLPTLYLFSINLDCEELYVRLL